jgi:hypothetical protein
MSWVSKGRLSVQVIDQQPVTRASGSAQELTIISVLTAHAETAPDAVALAAPGRASLS